jgi:hypothetical protein
MVLSVIFRGLMKEVSTQVAISKYEAQQRIRQNGKRAADAAAEKEHAEFMALARENPKIMEQVLASEVRRRLNAADAKAAADNEAYQIERTARAEVKAHHIRAQGWVDSREIYTRPDPNMDPTEAMRMENEWKDQCRTGNDRTADYAHANGNAAVIGAQYAAEAARIGAQSKVDVTAIETGDKTLDDWG